MTAGTVALPLPEQSVVNRPEPRVSPEVHATPSPPPVAPPVTQRGSSDGRATAGRATAASEDAAHRGGNNADQNVQSTAPTRPPVSTVRRITIPRGTAMPLILESAISPRARVGDPVRARVAQDVVVNKQLLIPRGTVLSGRVAELPRDSRLASALKFWELGRGQPVRLRFTRMRINDAAQPSYAIRSEVVTARRPRTARAVAVPAAFATVGGAMVAGPLGAAGGGLTASALAGSGTRAPVPRGTKLSTTLTDTVIVERSSPGRTPEGPRSAHSSRISSRSAARRAG